MSTEARHAERLALLDCGIELAPDPRTPVRRVDPPHVAGIGNAQIEALRTLHEAFSQDAAVDLSALLRSPVRLELVAIEQLVYGDFLRCLEKPTCFQVLRVEPLKCRWGLDIGPSILFPMLDRLLGGGCESSRTRHAPRDDGPHAEREDYFAARPLTEIERRLTTRITIVLLAQLGTAWKNVAILQPTVLQVESDPESVYVAAIGEAVVVLGFELSLGPARGMMRLCIPASAITRLAGRLALSGWLSAPAPGATGSSGAPPGLIELRAQLAEAAVTADELLAIQVGDIITTATPVRSPAIVSVEDVPKFLARVGVFQGHKAILIDEVIERPLECGD